MICSAIMYPSPSACCRRRWAICRPARCGRSRCSARRASACCRTCRPPTNPASPASNLSCTTAYWLPRARPGRSSTGSTRPCARWWRPKRSSSASWPRAATRSPRRPRSMPRTSTAKRPSGARWCAGSISRWSEPPVDLSGAQRKLDSIADWKHNGHIAVAGVAHVIEVARKRRRCDCEVIGHHQCARRELRLEEFEQRQVKLLPAVQQKQVDAAADAAGECLERVADADLDRSEEHTSELQSLRQIV